MKNLLIVYHSQSGSAAEMADAALRGAQRESGVETRLRRAADAALDDLLWADALLLGATENFGYLCGGMLDFLARVFYPAIDRAVILPYAVFISCGNDGRGALAQIERIAAGLPLRCVAEPEVARGEISDDTLARCSMLGQAMAAGLALGIF